MRWLRIKYEKPRYIQSNPIPCHIIWAIRDDGQMFRFWIFSKGENYDAIHRNLRRKLDAALNDPRLPDRIDEETGETISPLVPLDAYRGVHGWIEQNDI